MVGSNHFLRGSIWEIAASSVGTLRATTREVEAASAEAGHELVGQRGDT
jgi:hypothetical protein